MPSSDYDKDLNEIIFLDELSREEIEALNNGVFDNYLVHYGVGADDDPPGRGSGRYEKGSGENPNQHQTGYAARRKELKKQGFTEKQIAEALGFKSTADLRAHVTMDKEQRQVYYSMKIPEMAKSMNNTQIAKQLGISEGTVRNY